MDDAAPPVSIEDRGELALYTSPAPGASTALLPSRLAVATPAPAVDPDPGPGLGPRVERHLPLALGELLVLWGGALIVLDHGECRACQDERRRPGQGVVVYMSAGELPPEGQTPPHELTLAARINRCFLTMHPRGRGPWTNREVSAALVARGISLSSPYLSQLRTGERTKPSFEVVAALADFFGVPVTYFWGSTEEIDRIDAQIVYVEALRNAGLREVVTRARDLSPQGLRALAQMADALAQEASRGAGRRRETDTADLRDDIELREPDSQDEPGGDPPPAPDRIDAEGRRGARSGEHRRSQDRRSSGPVQEPDPSE